MQPVCTSGVMRCCLARDLSGTRQWLVVPKLWLFFWIASMEHRISYPGLRHFAMSAPSATFSRTSHSNCGWRQGPKRGRSAESQL
jgi:hypothetical protein